MSGSLVDALMRRQPGGMLDPADPVDRLFSRMPPLPSRYGQEMTMPQPDVVQGQRPDFGIPGGPPVVNPAENARTRMLADALTGATGSIRAYHGSPHAFDRFDMTKLGTGEGAQAYGHGLYFAEREGTARAYRDALAPAANVGAGGAQGMAARAMQRIADPAEAARSLDYNLGIAKAANGGVVPPDFLAQVDEARRLILSPSARGHMYEVDLHVDPNRLLDWDSGLRTTPDVRAAMIEAQRAGSLDLRRPPGVPPGEFNAPSGPTGRALWHAAVAGHGGPAQATEALRGAGIHGIQYLDAGSRAAGEGSRNYTIFEDQMIEILRRYGVAGLAAMGGLREATMGATADALAPQATP